MVTAPDDILSPGKRLLTFDLNVEQSQILSDVLKNLSFETDLILYVWKNGEPEEWLIDKMLKSDLILANSSTLNQIMFGYLLANKNKTHYFDYPTSLSFINNNQIHSEDLLTQLLEEFLNS
mgnify:FL=1